MANCVSIDGIGNVVTVNPQPADMITCSFVILTPAEFSNASQVPDMTAASEFFGFGFFMVVASFLAGWAVGQLRKTVRSGVS